MLGYVPASPQPPCAPSFNLTHRWRLSAWACEMDVLFLAPGVSAGRYEPFHSLGPVGCQNLVTLPETEMRMLATAAGGHRGPSAKYLPPKGTALMMGASMFFSRSWTGRSGTSRGEAYVCSADYFERDDHRAHGSSHLGTRSTSATAAVVVPHHELRQRGGATGGAG